MDMKYNKILKERCMEMKMNKEEYIKVLMVKTNRSEGECNILNQIIENHFIVGKNNKEKIINDIIQKLQLEYKEADELYNICM